MKNLAVAQENKKETIFIDNLDLVSGDPAEDGGADFGLVSIDIHKVNRCLARYSPCAKTTNRVPNGPARPCPK